MGCETRRDATGQVVMIVCSRGRRPPRCSVCGTRPGTQLCDGPGPGGGTCDAPVCLACTVHAEPDRDFCPAHAPAR